MDSDDWVIKIKSLQGVVIIENLYNFDVLKAVSLEGINYRLMKSNRNNEFIIKVLDCRVFMISRPLVPTDHWDGV